MEAPEVQVFQSRSWLQHWWDVWTLPGSESFAAMLSEPSAGAGRGMVWTILTGILGGIVYALAAYFFPDNALASMPESSRATVQSFGALGNLICIPFTTVVGMALSAGFYHFVARLFGGRGSWGNLVYCFAAIQCPLTLIGLVAFAVNSALGGGTTAASLNMVTVFIGLLNLVLAVYSLVLFVIAIKTAEGIGTFRAIMVVLIPVILAFALWACIVFGVLATLAPKLH
jgi:hypothetical protein